MQSEQSSSSSARARAVGNQVVEIVTALFVLALGAVGVVDSMRLGYRWADDGPQAGYFPFYISAIICIAAVWILVRALLKPNREAFLTRAQIKPVLSLFIPLTVYCVVIGLLGIYVASVLFIAYCMRTMGKYSWLSTVLVPVAIMGFFFAVFELWFKLPLPKGPVEALLGLQ